MLGVALRMSCCLFPKIKMVAGGCFFRPRKFLLQQNIDFDVKDFLGVTCKFRPRNFKNSEIGCTISQKKNHSELQKFKKGNVAAIWLHKKLWLRRPETFENEWQKRKHFLKILFTVAGVVKSGFYGLIFLSLDNTNYVMQNLIPKFRQNSIIS